VRTTGIALEMNPHLDQLLIAIVTVGAPRIHDVPISTTHRMSVHRLRRQADSDPALERLAVEVVPLRADLREGGLDLPAASTVDEIAHAEDGLALPVVLTVQGRERLVVPVPSERPRALLIDSLHPLVGPIFVATDVDPATGGLSLQPLASAWDSIAPAGPQLARMTRHISATDLQSSLDRVTELVGSLSETHVIVVGAGSVGSRIAEDLVRSGAGTLTVVDPDTVAAVNLARSVYSVDSLGHPKPAALADRLRSINPAVKIRPYEQAIAALDWPMLLSGVDLVVAATDDMAEQAALSHHAYAMGVPLVACALYRKAAAGEVVLAVPASDTACWACAVGHGTEASLRRPENDYGVSGRLISESALGPAINLVASVASQLAIGVLAGPASPAGAPLVRLLQEGRTLGIVATAPAWDFFSDLFAGQAHQHAPQSVWVKVQRHTDCPVCGSERVTPLTRDEGNDVIADLAALVDEERDPQGPTERRSHMASGSTCGLCRGSKKCQSCGGKGKFSTAATCPTCQGTKKCNSCFGTGKEP
jgi:molybdopterin/thiamine biosynthesis adenylyltransferase